jgi:hypothetical protein
VALQSVRLGDGCAAPQTVVFDVPGRCAQFNFNFNPLPI